VNEDDYQCFFTHELPCHQVTVPSFFMGKYPVTQAQYVAVMGNNPAEQYDADRFVAPEKPVVGVSWDDAQTFCQRLAEISGKDYRLPSEAEWEYACRAETETPFHFGLTINPELANYNALVPSHKHGQSLVCPRCGKSTVVLHGDSIYVCLDGQCGFRHDVSELSFSKLTRGIIRSIFRISDIKSKSRENRKGTVLVGSFPANRWGLNDMHGNVWEWCQDDYHNSYEKAPNNGSAWVNSKPAIHTTRHVLRGGSWDSLLTKCRSAYRLNSNSDYRDSVTGFRVCCDVPNS
jgi:formylglycine-generating enzyme required for sulfatase activity